MKLNGPVTMLTAQYLRYVEFDCLNFKKDKKKNFKHSRLNYNKVQKATEFRPHLTICIEHQSI